MRSPFGFLVLFGALALPFATVALPGTGEPSPVLSRAKGRGLIRCGGVERPGLAELGEKGQPAGLEVDLCRAVATALLGSPDRIAFRLYATPADFEGVRRQDDDVFFLSGSEIALGALAGFVLPLEPVFLESHAVMVAAGSPYRSVADLAGHGICFLIGSPSGRSLEAYFDGLHRTFLRHPYSEEGEMDDAYAVQRCHGLAGERTSLAKTRLSPGVNGLKSRILPQPLATYPILAATGTSDGRFAALVAWTIHTLVSAERPETRWYAGGAGAMPLPGEQLGLDSGWQRRVLATVGTYRDIFDRNLGMASPLKLERGLNANELEAGLLIGPFVD